MYVVLKFNLVINLLVHLRSSRTSNTSLSSYGYLQIDQLADLITFSKNNPDKLSVDVRKVPDKAIVAMHHKGELEDDLGYTSKVGAKR